MLRRFSTTPHYGTEDPVASMSGHIKVEQHDSTMYDPRASIDDRLESLSGRRTSEPLQDVVVCYSRSQSSGRNTSQTSLLQAPALGNRVEHKEALLGRL